MFIFFLVLKWLVQYPTTEIKSKSTWLKLLKNQLR